MRLRCPTIPAKRQLRLPFLPCLVSPACCIIRVTDRTLLNSPNPALVTQRAAQRLPRWRCCCSARPMCCRACSAATPGRMPTSPPSATWSSIAAGPAPPGWQPDACGGLPADGALLPYWLGARLHPAAGAVARPGPGRAHSVRPAAGAGAGPDLVRHLPPGPHRGRPALALRLRRRSQPGRLRPRRGRRRPAGPDRHPGPAATGPRDHARAGATGRRRAVPVRRWPPPVRGRCQARLAAAGALPVTGRQRRARMACGLGVRRRAVLCRRSSYPQCAASPRWVLAARSLAALRGHGAGRLGLAARARRAAPQCLGASCACSPGSSGRPGRWRCGRCGAGAGMLRRHIAVPLGCAVRRLVACVADGRLRPRADARRCPRWRCWPRSRCPRCSAAPRRPSTGSRSSSSRIGALVIWVIYVAMQTGVPAKPAANVARLAPGFAPQFSGVSLLLRRARHAGLVWLVRWRTGRHRHPLWKSLVLPAGGVALCWLLLMTLWLPLLDYARSYRPLVQRIARHVPRSACIARPACRRRRWRRWSTSGGYRVDAVTRRQPTRSCDFLLLVGDAGRRSAARGRLDVRGTRAAPHQREEITAHLPPSAAELAPTMPLTPPPAQTANQAVGRVSAAGPRLAVPADAAPAPPETPGGSSSPCPARCARRSSPPWRCTTCLTIDSPGPCRRFRANGCRRRGRSARSGAGMCSRAMPMPVSRTAISPPPSAAAPQRTSMPPAVGRVAHRVGDQVGHGAEQFGLGAGDLDAPVVAGKPMAWRPADSARHRPAPARSRRVDRHPAVRPAARAALELRQRQQVGHQGLHALRLLRHQRRARAGARPRSAAGCPSSR